MPTFAVKVGPVDAKALGQLAAPNAFTTSRRLAECPVEVGDQILDVFDADTQPNEIARNFKLSACHGCVSHRVRMLDQGLHAAE